MPNSAPAFILRGYSKTDNALMIREFQAIIKYAMAEDKHACVQKVQYTLT